MVKSEPEEEETPARGLPPRTPGKGKHGKSDTSTPKSTTPKIADGTYGSVTTPGGRRSARVAKKSVQRT